MTNRINRDDLSKAIENSGVESDRFDTSKKYAQYILDYFRGHERMMDNDVPPEDRYLFRKLEDVGMVTFYNEEISISKFDELTGMYKNHTRGWRMCFIDLNIRKIQELACPIKEPKPSIKELYADIFVEMERDGISMPV